jgi:hypothetical protein
VRASPFPRGVTEGPPKPIAGQEGPEVSLGLDAEAINERG